MRLTLFCYYRVSVYKESISAIKKTRWISVQTNNKFQSVSHVSTGKKIVYGSHSKHALSTAT